MDESPPTAGSLYAMVSEPFLRSMNASELSLSLHYVVALLVKVETLARVP